MNHKTDMQAPTEIYVWFADNKGTERDGERFIRAWTMDPVRADGLRGAIGKAPAVYRAIEASQSAGVAEDLLPNALWTRHGSGIYQWWSYKGYEARKDTADQWVLRKGGEELYRHTYLQVVMAHAERELLAAHSAGEQGPVAVVDENDDGLFIEILYGDNGSPLKRGDALYAHPQPMTDSDGAQEPVVTCQLYGQVLQTCGECNHESGIPNLTAEQIKNRLHDYPRLMEFFSKHGLGPKSAPSCLVCGNSTQGREVAIKHAELPEIVVCTECRNAAQPQPMPQTDAARDQLRHFANAERFNRAVFADDSAFADWVIRRSRHVLAEIERIDRSGE